MVVAPSSHRCPHSQITHRHSVGQMARRTCLSLHNGPVPLLNPPRIHVRPLRQAVALTTAVPIPCFLAPLHALTAAWDRPDPCRTHVCPRTLLLRSATLEGPGRHQCALPSLPRNAPRGASALRAGVTRHPVWGIAVRPAQGIDALGWHRKAPRSGCRAHIAAAP
jgi:hypothetical protein